MLNSTSNYYEQPKIEFEVMGLSHEDSDFLNWCMANRDNLEFIRSKSVLELQSASAVLYFDELKSINRVDKTSVEHRA